MGGLKTAILLATLSGLFIAVGGMLGGESGIIMAFGFALVMNVGSYWFSDKIVLRMYKAQPVGPGHRLYDMTARLAQRAQLPMPKVYVIPDAQPNAFATGRNPKNAAVAATEGIMRLLPDSELEGVMAHELAHVKNRDILISTVAATIGAAISMMANMAQFSMLFGGSRDREEGGSHPIAMIATIFLAPLAAMLIQMAVSRSREFVADRVGADIAGTPMGLAGALQRMENASKQLPPMDANPATAHMFILSPLRGGGIASLFSTHPPTKDRVDALMRIRMGNA
jgi:heat shock protein HtpX